MKHAALLIVCIVILSCILSNCAIAESHLYDNVEVFDLASGGQYSLIKAKSSDCTESALCDWLYNYIMENDHNYDLILYTDSNNNEGIVGYSFSIETGVILGEDSKSWGVVDETSHAEFYAPDYASGIVKEEY